MAFVIPALCPFVAFCEEGEAGIHVFPITDWILVLDLRMTRCVSSDTISEMKKTQKESCPFCDFQDKNVIVYDDRVCFAIISKSPINKYHILVIPKKHYRNFIDLPDEVATRIFLIAKKLSGAVRKACKPVAVCHISDDDIYGRGYNLVSHYKFHIIPRFKNDGIVMKWKRYDLDIKKLSQIAATVKKYLS